jgi:8-oxo-dGTP pyrophosphatase MutT (NUDIX family)/phosphohistidine phosphatase SixA
VRAAGGLVVHDGRILLVHRPRFDDWSLPKGKLLPGEHPLLGAVREVFEETMVIGVPGVRLPSVTYLAGSGPSPVNKIVDWWAMTVADADPFEPTDEVDRIAWLPLPQARERVTYERDRIVLAAYAALPAVSRPVVLLRHASAGDRRTGPEAPDDRPLDDRGRAQAAALVELLRVLRPGRLVSAPARRCQQTLTELARALHVDLEIVEDIAEGAGPAAAGAALRRFASDEAATIVCGPGGAILGALTALSGDGASTRAPSDGAPIRTLAPADGVVLSFSGDTLVAADPFSPALP